MSKPGPKPKPTKLKEIQGTLKPSRQLENEMTATVVSKLPEAPEILDKMGRKIWKVVTKELFNKGMLHSVDLPLLSAYCNEMSIYIEMENFMREHGRIQFYYNEAGQVRHSQSVPQQKIANDALSKAHKIAVQFGFTPSARTSIGGGEEDIDFFDL
jgi:P27 family predicted phage terminase small subunit|tara:strand:- start:275 stop:742 length:468 start_codon:yes stop_codon:yes gene_type:complete